MSWATWSEYLMGMARHAALKSRDETKVGCVVVGPEKVPVVVTFNGPPIGVRESAERRERPVKYLYTSHAEENAVAFAARYGIGLAGMTAYVTHMPCARCARSLIQAGIRRIIYAERATRLPPEEFEASAIMCREAGVEMIQALPAQGA